MHMTPKSKLAAILALLFLISCSDDGGSGPSNENSAGGSSSGVSRDGNSENGSSSSADDEDGSSSSAVSFVLSTMTDERDGAVYKTTTIGSQTWMAENLRYEYKIDGSTYGNWCYENDSANCVKYGRYYTWAAAMDSATTGCGYGVNCSGLPAKVQGVCPSGWHLPSRQEWSVLNDVVDEHGITGSVSGKKLKSTEGWKAWNEGDDNNGVDAYGFSAQPYGGFFGIKEPDKYLFNYMGDDAYFWSSTEYGDAENIRAEQVNMTYDKEWVIFFFHFKDRGLSVRCVKN